MEAEYIRGLKNSEEKNALASSTYQSSHVPFSMPFSCEFHYGIFLSECALSNVSLSYHVSACPMVMFRVSLMPTDISTQHRRQ